ncbi:unnamed protein product [Dracunculus medinensis]|uniref:Biogenesis of lysosome-related organelles complex 1 subunit 1 n=1 Tax=Dracunculus medinensis TaxID=318479 RepID=A0A0N4U8F1_DRAME|nr:unnamed protein product [Dracunculus medinensis]
MKSEEKTRIADLERSLSRERLSRDRMKSKYADLSNKLEQAVRQMDLLRSNSYSSLRAGAAQIFTNLINVENSINFIRNSLVSLDDYCLRAANLPLANITTQLSAYNLARLNLRFSRDEIGNDNMKHEKKIFASEFLEEDVH